MQLNGWDDGKSQNYTKWIFWVLLEDTQGDGDNRAENQALQLHWGAKCKNCCAVRACFSNRKWWLSQWPDHFTLSLGSVGLNLYAAHSAQFSSTLRTSLLPCCVYQRGSKLIKQKSGWRNQIDENSQSLHTSVCTCNPEAWITHNRESSAEADLVLEVRVLQKCFVDQEILIFGWNVPLNTFV